MQKKAKFYYDNLDYFSPLEVVSIFKKYNEKSSWAIEDISFSCKKGEIVGILGENGAGKSTTLKCITGIIPQTTGEIRICGYNMATQTIQAKQCFSFVTDNHSTFEKMTGMQYLSFMADVYGVSNQRRKDMYELLEQTFQLGESVNNIIASYSHGMKQKICMMASLIHEPKLWILDEPMVGLDPHTQWAVGQFMENYVKDGKSILFSSHNLDAVRRICHRTLIISSGKLIANLELDQQTKDTPSILENLYGGKHS